MKFRTFLSLFLLLLTINLSAGCGSRKNDALMSNEEVQAQLEKEGKVKAKAAKKAQKEAHKRYWNAQSKQARKSIKENLKRQKRMARHRKRN